MDTISLHQAGFDSAVATLGTALTGGARQAPRPATPKRWSSAYDADGAGVQAATRGPSPCWRKTGLKVRVLQVTGRQGPG